MNRSNSSTSLHKLDKSYLSFPLTAAQRGIWFSQQLNHNASPDVYKTAEYLDIPTTIRVDLFKLALQRVVQETETLHLTFSETEQGPRQALQLNTHWHVPVLDFTQQPNPEDRARQYMQSDINKPYDPYKGPFLSFALIQLSPSRYYYYQCFHHQVMDGFSASLFTARLAELYNAYLEEICPPENPLRGILEMIKEDESYPTSKAYLKDQKYWKKQLSEELTPVSLVNHRKPISSIRRFRRKFSEATNQHLRYLASECQSTMAQLLVTLIGSYLYRMTGQSEIQIGFPTVGRTSAALRKVPGLAANTVPLCLSFDRHLSLVGAASQIKRNIFSALKHQRYREEMIRSDLNANAYNSRFYATTINIIPFDYRIRFGGTEASVHNLSIGPTEDLTITVFDRGPAQAMELCLDANSALYSDDALRTHLERIIHFCTYPIEYLNQPIKNYPILSDDERNLVLYQFNQTEAPYPESMGVHEVFAQQVRRYPEHTALITESQQVSYTQLNLQANRVAQILREKGVQVGQPIALIIPRSLELVVAELAILKCGAIYVPIDPDTPSLRRNFVLEDCGAQVVLTHPERPIHLGTPFKIIQLTKVLMDQGSAEEVGEPIMGTAPACILYTSGSTGHPKGVVLPHRGINRLVVNGGFIDYQVGDRVAFVANPAFDASTLDIWGPLLNAGAVVVIPQEVLLQPEAFQTWLVKHRISILLLTVGLFNHYAGLMGPALSRLRYLIIGGDALDPAPIQRLLNLNPPSCLLNAYGPTEATTVSLTYPIQAVTDITQSIPIGRPIANSRVYILDNHQQPVPLGVCGEIYLAGDGIALEYLNKPELTASCFLPDPFVDDPQARMYRSGDLGCWYCDGTIKFLGRSDSQVKIRGYRIELGEIVSVMQTCGGVQEAVVVAKTDDHDNKQLIAYYVGDADARTIHETICVHLPDYMVPAAYIALERIPLTANGKVDHKILPDPDQNAFIRDEYEEPQSETEKTLAGIWQSLLKIDRAGRHDHFFSLGGNSLLALQLCTQIRAQFSREITFPEIFSSPLLREQASLLPLATVIEKQAMTPLPPGETPPLSPAQQRLWMLTRLDQSSLAAYTISFGLHFQGTLDKSALQQALDRIAARHAPLRSHFAHRDGQTIQVVADVDHGFPLISVNARDDTTSLQSFMPSINLETGPLAQARLIRFNDQEHWLQFAIHHLISDGWSINVLINELYSLYEAFIQHQPDPLPSLSIQYGDYAAWQHQSLTEEVLDMQKSYWQQQLQGIPEWLTLPTDRPRPTQQDYAGATVALSLDEKLTAALHSLSKRHGCTLYMTLLAAWAALMGRLAHQEDIVIGSPVAGRHHIETEPLIGMFINTLAMRIDLSATPDIATLLLRVKETVLAAQSHQTLPFEQVVEVVSPVRHLSHSPIFQVMFSLQDALPIEAKLSDLTLTELPRQTSTAQFDLTLELFEAQGKIGGYLTYATSLFDKKTVQNYLENWQRLLRGMVFSSPGTLQQPIQNLPILSEYQHRQLIFEFNEPSQSHPVTTCIHEQFEHQVAIRPEELAVICETTQLTYAALNKQANQLAHRLIASGVRPDSRVAIALERQCDLMVAILATLKAGGAYVPLDPTYPQDRLAYIIRDSTPEVVLTSSLLSSQVQAWVRHTPMIEVDAELTGLTDNIPTERIGLTQNHLAYIIYTSGSTGQPKGVMVEHRNVMRLFDSTQDHFQFNDQDVWTLFHSYAFDFSVWEMWGALLYGGRLMIVPFLTARSPLEFYPFICEHQVTVLNQTPSAFRQLTAAQKASKDSHSLRYVIFGGEALELSSLEPWYRQNTGQTTQLINMYGITETTVHTTYHPLSAADVHRIGPSPIGKPLSDLRIYILDTNQAPVPINTVGEIYISGDGVTRGYLNRPDLTDERFFKDPLAGSDTGQTPTRMYRTGDLGRWRHDGTIEYLGRNDHQVKIRGFRIELGEIEACIRQLPDIEDVVVLALKDQSGNDRLTAYFVGEVSVETLRELVSTQMPDYMTPATWVKLNALPLTPNGKLNYRALPEPDASAIVQHHYEKPQGDAEQALARLWSELLGVAQVGRLDNFFELGGHSLLAIQLIEKLRLCGYDLPIKALFNQPNLKALAASLGKTQDKSGDIPDYSIPYECNLITPDMLPLTELSQSQINHIVQTVPGGTANIQDIYPLAPLQEGIFFHHLLEETGDPYVVRLMLGFKTLAQVNNFVEGLQSVIHRHDIFRTSIAWKGLSEPVQVVWRNAVLSVTVLDIHEDDVIGALQQQFSPAHTRLDLKRAPMMEVYQVADAAHDRWVLCLVMHHLCNDHTSLELMLEEVQAHLNGKAEQLPEPLPFRRFISTVKANADPKAEAEYFRSKLGDIESPSIPFGLTPVRDHSRQFNNLNLMLEAPLAQSLRHISRQLNVSCASLFHLAWGLVVRATTAQDDVVFGTVLFGRMSGGEGADRMIGLFLNTLPLRLSLAQNNVHEAVLQTHRSLSELLDYEHTSLALAQQCSSVEAQLPLFTSLLNYRYDGGNKPFENDLKTQKPVWHQMDVLHSEEQSNYPISVSVNDHLHQGFSVDLQIDKRIDVQRIGNMLIQALAQIAASAIAQPDCPVRQLQVLSEADYDQLKKGFWSADRRLEKANTESHMLTQQTAPMPYGVDALFEQQVAQYPDAVAIITATQRISYAQLNQQANRLAHYLRSQGISSQSLVCLCCDRSADLFIAMMAILKAGAGYVPIDPFYPEERLHDLLSDSKPDAVLTDGIVSLTSVITRASPDTQLINLKDEANLWADLSPNTPKQSTRNCQDLAYVIYTSGSTGQPKGVMVSHANLINLVKWNRQAFAIQMGTRTSSVSGLSFDAMAWEVWPALCSGATLTVPSLAISSDPAQLLEWWKQQPIDVSFLPTPIAELAFLRELAPPTLQILLVGGDRLTRLPATSVGYRVINNYGPTETTVVATSGQVVAKDDILHIGYPIEGSRIYILDKNGQLLPFGVTGEIYIAGANVAKGYLNRPDLSAERFLIDPFSDQPNARMYRSGDLGRWRTDGTIEFLGRNDDQVKIRGIRIEPGEIATCLNLCTGVQNVVVIAKTTDDDIRLIAYYIGDVEVATLRTHAATYLPSHMIPTVFIQVSHFPLTPNGKVDRKALPEPETTAYIPTAFQPPESDTEIELSIIWSELLHVKPIGRESHFFELGGHSLLAVKLQARVQETFNVDITLSDLFTTPTLKELALSIAQQQLKQMDPETLKALAIEAGYDASELVGIMTKG